MKSLIIYKSKHGFTKERALEIALKLNIDCVNIDEIKKININNYDQIIIGTYLYMFSIPSKIIKFCKKNFNILKTKDVYLFLTGIDELDNIINIVKTKLPEDFIKHIKGIYHFGGDLRIEQAKFIEKAIMKKLLEENKFKFGVKEEEVDKFIKEISGDKK